jgi:hypothetical protein
MWWTNRTVEALTKRVRELEEIVDILANHSAHMMYNQANGWKPYPKMTDNATDLEVRAARASWKSK